MSWEDGGKELLPVVKTLEEVLRGLKILRPDSYKSYSIRQSQIGGVMGVQIMIGENSIICERKDGQYEIFPKVNGETIVDLFGDYPDTVCRYLTLEQAVKIAEAAQEAKGDPSRLPNLKKTIDDCYPDGFAESAIAMTINQARAHLYVKPGFPGFIEDRINKQFKRHIEQPRLKKEREEGEE